MILPLLISVLLMTLAVGAYMVRHAELNVSNRNEAWRERYKGTGSRPFQFSQLGKLSKSGSAATTLVSMFPLGAAEANHVVLGGTWDHRQLPMNHPPHFKLYVEAAKSAPGNEFASRLGAADRLAELPNALKNSVQASANLDGLLKPGIQEKLQEILNLQSLVSETTSAGHTGAISEGKKDLEKLKANEGILKQRLSSELPGELKAAQDQIAAAVAINPDRLAQVVTDAQLRSGLVDALNHLNSESGAVRIEQNYSNMKEEARKAKAALDNVRANLKETNKARLDQLIVSGPFSAAAAKVDGVIKRARDSRTSLGFIQEQVSKGEQQSAEANNQANPAGSQLNGIPTQAN